MAIDVSKGRDSERVKDRTVAQYAPIYNYKYGSFTKFHFSVSLARVGHEPNHALRLLYSTSRA